MSSKPIPKVKKVPKKRPIAAKLDVAFSKYIRARDGRCVVCGSTENLQNGHFFSRIFWGIRWDEKNCHAQCASCNKTHEYNPMPYLRYMEAVHGRGVIADLERRKSNVVSIPWMQEKLQWLRERGYQ